MRKILVYDKKKYFLIYIKKKFYKEFILEKKSLPKMDNYIYSNVYCCIVFVAYHEEDVVPFLDYLALSLPIIVCSENKALLNMYGNIPEIICVDIGLDKQESYKLLETNIKLKVG